MVAIRRGFDRERHFVPVVRDAVPEGGPAPVIFWARVENDAEWERVAPFVRRFLRAFSAADPVELHVTLGPDADPEAITRRIERAAEKAGIAPDATPEIVIADEEPPLDARLDALAIDDASPSALRRLIETAAR